MSAVHDDQAKIVALQAENDRLKRIVCRCNADWCRLKDFIIAGNGPEEMFRFKEAEKNGNKGVEMFLDYIDSLWSELARIRRENQSGPR